MPDQVVDPVMAGAIQADAARIRCWLGSSLETRRDILMLPLQRD
jgi:hypothetical protein